MGINAKESWRTWRVYLVARRHGRPLTTRLSRFALLAAGMIVMPLSSVPPAVPRHEDAIVGIPNAGVRLRDGADGYLYLGPFRSLTLSAPNVSSLRSPARLAEFQRRACMIFGRGADTIRLFRAPASPLFFSSGQRVGDVRYEPIDAPPRDESAPPPPLRSPLPEPCATLLARPPR